jgi:diguanylate cyclase (GGDEF)-like protein/PAS domain S-box-containing protein
MADGRGSAPGKSNFRTRKQQRLDAVTRLSVAKAFLDQHPQAWIIGLESTGQATTVPDELVRLAHGRVISSALTGLELVDVADRDVAGNIWRRMMKDGVAEGSVHPVGDPDALVGLHIVDLRETHGVFLFILTGLESDSVLPTTQSSSLIPRSAVMRRDGRAIITSVDEAITALLGWSVEELVGRRMLDFVHPDDRDEGVANFIALLGRPGSLSRMRLRHRHANGSWRWLEVTNHNRLADPDDPHILTDIVDVDDEVRALQAIRANEQKLRRLADALPVGVLYINREHTIDFINHQVAAVTGISDASDLSEQFAAVEDGDREALSAALQATMSLGYDRDLELTFNRPSGGKRRGLLSLRAITDDSGAVMSAVACIADVTGDVARREELERRVRYDQLTGCLSHVSVLSELQQWLDEPIPNSWTVVVFVDLDGFKETNDRYGHLVGDRLLKHVAARLREVAGEEAIVGRLGGDEFLIAERTADNPRALIGAAGRAAAALDSPILVANDPLLPKASIGLAYACSADVVNADMLVAAADAAMYESKRLSDGTPVHARHDDHPGDVHRDGATTNAGRRASRVRLP